MVAGNVAVTVYLTYAALMAALIMCSLLSPIQVRSVGDREMRVYGVMIVYHAPPVSWVPPVSDRGLDSSSSSAGVNSGDEASGSSSSVDTAVPVRMSLYDLPSSTLKRSMSAYLAFAGMSVASSVAFLVMLMVQRLPLDVNCAVLVVTRAFAVLLSLATVLCFTMAAVLGLQSELYRDVAAGYYTDFSEDAVTAKLHSGFSSSVVAAFLGLVVILFSPVFWKE